MGFSCFEEKYIDGARIERIRNSRWRDWAGGKTNRGQLFASWLNSPPTEYKLGIGGFMQRLKEQKYLNT